MKKKDIDLGYFFGTGMRLEREREEIYGVSYFLELCNMQSFGNSYFH